MRGQRVLTFLLVLSVVGLAGAAAIAPAAASTLQSDGELGASLDYVNSDDQDTGSITVSVDDGTLMFAGSADSGSHDRSDVETSWDLVGEAQGQLEPAEPSGTVQNYTLSEADAGHSFDVVFTAEAGDETASDSITVTVEDDSEETAPSVEVESVAHGTADSIDVATDDGTLTFVGSIDPGSYDSSELDRSWTTEGDAASDLEQADLKGAAVNYTLSSADAGATFDVVLTVEAGEHTASDSLTVNVAEDDQTAPDAQIEWVDEGVRDGAEVEVSDGTMTFYAKDVSTPDEYDRGDVSYDWSIDGEASNEIVVDSDAADMAAQYELAEADAGTEFDVVLTLSGPEDQTSTARFTVTVSSESDGEAPDAPSSVEATAAGESTVDVSWEAVADADHYNVYVDGVFETSVEDTSASVYELDADTTYDIGVSAESDAGESEQTTDSVTTGVAAPSAPTGLEAVVGDDTTIDVSWDAVDGASEYNVYVDGDVANTVEGTSVTLDGEAGIEDGEYYDIVVTAVNDGGESEEASVTATTADHVVEVAFEDEQVEPGETTNLSFVLPEVPETGVNGVTLEIDLDGSVATLTREHDLAADTWNYVTMDMNYSEAAGGDESMGVVSVNNADTAIDPGATDVALGSVEVQAHAEGTIEDAVSIREYQDLAENPVDAAVTSASLTVAERAPPSAPEDVSASATGETSVDVSWDAVENADQYRVYVDGDLEETVDGTSASVDGLSAGTTYTLSVRAANEHGESDPANATATTDESSSGSSGGGLGGGLGGGSSSDDTTSDDSGGEGGEGDGDTQEGGFVLSTASTTVPLVFEGQNAQAGVSASTGVDAAVGPVELQTFGATAAQDASSFELTVDSVAGPEHMQDRVLAAFAIQDGAEMVNDAELNFAIDEDELPEGVTAEDLHVYGQQDGSWQEASVDPTSSVATAQLSQYDALAVVGPDEPETEVDGDDGGIGTLGIVVVLLLLGAAAGAAFYLRP